MKTQSIIYKAICAACGAVVREGQLYPGGFVSHGTCRVCARYALNQAEIWLLEWGQDAKKEKDRSGQGRSVEA